MPHSDIVTETASGELELSSASVSMQRGGHEHGTVRRVLGILWPAFLMAGVLEILVFAFVDPQAMHDLGGAPLGWSSGAIYTGAFFAFWAAITFACALAVLLAAPASVVNDDVSKVFRR